MVARFGSGHSLTGLRASLSAVSVALLASYFVLVLLQVFFRYVLNESLFWAEELVRGAMLWGIMLSSALVARLARAHPGRSARIDAAAGRAACRGVGWPTC